MQTPSLGGHFSLWHVSSLKGTEQEEVKYSNFRFGIHLMCVTLVVKQNTVPLWLLCKLFSWEVFAIPAQSFRFIFACAFVSAFFVTFVKDLFWFV